MSDNMKRQPKGIPVGGQFAENDHDEAPSALFPEPENVTFSQDDLNDATHAASASLLWSSPEAEEWSAENEDEPYMHHESMNYLRKEIEDFAEAYPELVHAAEQSGYSATDGTGFPGAFGHDFALERSGAGVGFYDRRALRYGNLGEVISRRIGARDLHMEIEVGDDDKMHVASHEYTRKRTTEADRALDDALEMSVKGGASRRESALAAKQLLRDAGLRKYLSYKGQRKLDDALGLSFDRDEDDE